MGVIFAEQNRAVGRAYLVCPCLFEWAGSVSLCVDMRDGQPARLSTGRTLYSSPFDYKAPRRYHGSIEAQRFHSVIWATAPAAYNWIRREMWNLLLIATLIWAWALGSRHFETISADNDPAPPPIVPTMHCLLPAERLIKSPFVYHLKTSDSQ